MLVQFERSEESIDRFVWHCIFTAYYHGLVNPLVFCRKARKQQPWTTVAGTGGTDRFNLN
jgi:hypothetical protein